MGNVVGFATERICPACGVDFLVRKVDDGIGDLECPGCGYEEAADE